MRIWKIIYPVFGPGPDIPIIFKFRPIIFKFRIKILKFKLKFFKFRPKFLRPRSNLIILL